MGILQGRLAAGWDGDGDGDGEVVICPSLEDHFLALLATGVARHLTVCS